MTYLPILIMRKHSVIFHRVAVRDGCFARDLFADPNSSESIQWYFLTSLFAMAVLLVTYLPMPRSSVVFHCVESIVKAALQVI